MINAVFSSASPLILHAKTEEEGQEEEEVNEEEQEDIETKGRDKAKQGIEGRQRRWFFKYDTDLHNSP